MRYLLNAAVITGPGTYTYRLTSAEKAAEWLRQGDFISRIGYPATADHIKSISGIKPEVNREATIMQAGDEALIVRLKYRLPDPKQKASYVPGPDDWEYGVLKKLES